MLKFAIQLTRLAHSMGKSVTVEGVEDSALLEAMAIIGAERVQGFAIARPMSARKLDSWLGNGMQRVLADLSRPSSRLGKLAQLLVWEESLCMCSIAMSETRKLKAGSASAGNMKQCVDPLLIELSNGLPHLADADTHAKLVCAATHHGFGSPQYLNARREMVDRIADDEAFD